MAGILCVTVALISFCGIFLSAASITDTDLSSGYLTWQKDKRMFTMFEYFEPAADMDLARVRHPHSTNDIPGECPGRVHVPIPAAQGRYPYHIQSYLNPTAL